MRKKSFYLYKRFSKRLETHVYYVKFRDLTSGKYGSGKCSDQTSVDDANTWAIEQLTSIKTKRKQEVFFEDFTKCFFDSSNSDYLKNLQQRGIHHSSAHNYNQQLRLRKHILPFFEGKTVDEIDENDVEAFRTTLLEKRLSPSSVNKILADLGIILKWAAKRKLRPACPRIEMVRMKVNRRGILEEEEVRNLFSLEWPSEIYLAINLLAVTTGMRLSEIISLKRYNIKGPYILVDHAWDVRTGIKSTKTEKNRTLGIPPRVQKLLSTIMDGAKWKEEDDFIFPSKDRRRPINRRMVELILYRQMMKIGIDEETRKRRKIDFHSWRHFVNALLINKGIPVLKVQSITGHMSDSMTERYYHPDKYSDVIAITNQIVGEV